MNLLVSTANTKFIGAVLLPILAISFGIGSSQAPLRAQRTRSPQVNSDKRNYNAGVVRTTGVRSLSYALKKEKRENLFYLKSANPLLAYFELEFLFLTSRETHYTRSVTTSRARGPPPSFFSTINT